MRSPISSSQSPTGVSAGRGTRTGTVLIRSPTIPSTPSTGAPRPPRTTPKTASSLPVYRPSRRAHAPGTSVLSHTPRPRSKARSEAASSAGS
jgi:hypothetical protein